MNNDTMKLLINHLYCYKYNNDQLSILYSWLGKKLFDSNSDAFNDFMDIKNHKVDLMTGSALIRSINKHKIPNNFRVNNRLDHIIDWIHNHSAGQYYDNGKARYTYGLYLIIHENSHESLNKATQSNFLDFVNNLYPKRSSHKNVNSKPVKSAKK